ncbi:MAG: M56 family metallopeptidase [Mariniblastus sp.]
MVDLSRFVDFLSTQFPEAVFPVLETVGWFLLHSVWQILLITVLVRMLLFFVADQNATVRYRIAMSGLFLSLAIPVLTWGKFGPPVQFDVEGVDAFAFVMEQPRIKSDIAPVIESGFEAMVPVSANGNTRSLSFAQRVTAIVKPWFPVLSIIWLAGVLVCSLRPVIGMGTIWRLKRTGVSVDPRLDKQFQLLIARFQLGRTVRLVESAFVKVPMVVGVMRPVVMLPASVLTNLSAEELDSILAHELAHLKRFDDVFNLVQVAIESLLFFHPCVWWLSRLARQERENCCDDMSVAVCGDASSLATALLHIEESRQFQPALMANGGSLVKRIRRLQFSNQKETSMQCTSVRRLSPLVCLIAFSALLGLGGIAFATQNHDNTKKDNYPSLNSNSTLDLESGKNESFPRKQERPADSDSWNVKIERNPVGGTLTIRSEDGDLLDELAARIAQTTKRGVHFTGEGLSQIDLSKLISGDGPIFGGPDSEKLNSTLDNMGRKFDALGRKRRFGEGSVPTLFALRYQDAASVATELAKIHNALENEFGPIEVNFNERLNSIRVYGSEKAVKRIGGMIEELDLAKVETAKDAPGSKGQLSVFQLEHRKATDVVSFLSDFLSNAPVKVGAEFRCQVLGRDNCVVVYGTDEEIALVKQFIKTLDAPAAKTVAIDPERKRMPDAEKH